MKVSTILKSSQRPVKTVNTRFGFKHLFTPATLFLFCLFFHFSQKSHAQTNVDILVVGAGGGGGGHNSNSTGNRTGGGGGGGVVYLQGNSLSTGSYTVTVAPTTSGIVNRFGNNGSSSSFISSVSGGISMTANGGGGGGGNGSGSGGIGGSGGGGHGGANGGSATKGSCSGHSGGTYITYGNNGGNCSSNQGGGGGGAGAAGGISDGGQGVSISITGASLTYGSGGGGNGPAGGAGGANAGFGTSGSSATGNGGNINAADNFGGGGGGSSCGGCSSGAGGSGVVILSYASSTSYVSGVGGSGQATCTTTTYNIGSTTYQVHKFTGSGTFVFTVGHITANPSSSTQNICLNGTATALSVTTNGTSPSYQWYSNTSNSNAGGTIIYGATTNSYTPPTTAAGTTYYYCSVTATMGGNVLNQTSTVSGAINIGSVAGSISGATTVTSSTNSTTLTTSGHLGSVQWQTSSNNSTFSDISGSTATTYTASNISATTYYRVKVTNGSCAAVYSSSVAILYQPGTAAATTATLTTTGSTSVTNNVATNIDPGITVTSNGSLTGFSVSITNNYTTGDELSYTGSLPTGVNAAAFNTTSRSLVFSGTASASDWQDLLRRVQIKTTSASCNPETRRVSFTASTNYYNHFNGHFYEYSPTIRTWTAAKEYAESQSFFGRKGYLVTVSSAVENAFIYSLINQNTWIGCSDNFSQINSAAGYTKYSSQSLAEGQWHWITGPEKGVKIRTGNASTAEKAGSAVSGIYQNWNLGGQYGNNEPNDVWSSGTPGQEDYGHLWGNTGKWNDFPNRGRACIIEYGDMPGDNPVNTLEATQTINVGVAATGTISGGGVSVCSSTNSTALTYSASGGYSVVRWESSPDNFLATTTSIASTSSTYTATNISETTSYRVVISSGSCVTSTAPVTITHATINAGTIVSSDATICENTSAKLSLSGCTGSVTKWQVSTTSGSGFSDISSSASSSLSYSMTTAGTRYFRAVVNNTSCSTTTNSDEYIVTVSASSTPAGGEVSSNAHCGINNSGTLVLSGSGGSSYSWEYSTDNGSNWISASNTTTYLNYTNISQNRLYRVLVSDGACGSTNSSNGSITIYGTTKTLFTGAVSGDWSNGQNWCSGVIADNGSDMDVSPTCGYDILLDKNRRVGQLKFLYGSKYVKLGNYNLTANNISGNDSLNHIKITGTGVLKMGLGHTEQKTFAIGKSTYNPVTITNKTNQTDTFTTSLLDDVFGKGTCCVPLTTPRVKRTWIITKGNGTANSGDGVDFTFNWYKNEISGTINTYRMYHFNGSNWDKTTPASSSVVDTAYYSHNGYKGSFSPFAMGDDVVLLPVIWQSMSCSRGSENTASVNWSTGSETQSDSFIVERATPGGGFVMVGSVKAAGYSSTPRRYSLTDKTASKGVLFYRVKQKDEQGNASYSEICEVAPTSSEEGNVKIFPNPADQNVQVVLGDGDMNGMTVSITNSAGVMVAGKTAKGHSVEFPTAKLPAGLYIIRVSGPGMQPHQHKMVIQHP
jgi:hypothetical protein